MNEDLRHPIVLFDGVCNYCNTMVNFAIKHNKKKDLRFGSLQSKLGAELRAKYNIDVTIDSLIFIENGKAFIYSSAALMISRHLSFPYNLCYGFIIIPTFIREAVYKWIAKNRYKWFGKKDACMIPTPEMRNLFLDQ